MDEFTGDRFSRATLGIHDPESTKPGAEVTAIEFECKRAENGRESKLTARLLPATDTRRIFMRLGKQPPLETSYRTDEWGKTAVFELPLDDLIDRGLLREKALAIRYVINHSVLLRYDPTLNVGNDELFDLTINLADPNLRQTFADCGRNFVS